MNRLNVGDYIELHPADPDEPRRRAIVTRVNHTRNGTTYDLIIDPEDDPT